MDERHPIPHIWHSDVAGPGNAWSTGAMEGSPLAAVLAEAGPRSRRVPDRRRVTLAELSDATGIKKSTLSRLESGQRTPSLGLLLPIARAHQVPLDELVGAPGSGTLGCSSSRDRNGRVVIPLTRQAGGVQPREVVLDPTEEQPTLRLDEGDGWLDVLAGEMRLTVADHDITMGRGEAAELDTAVPHGSGAARDEPVALRSLLAQPGDRIHVRAAPRRRTSGE